MLNSHSKSSSLSGSYSSKPGCLRGTLVPFKEMDFQNLFRFSSCSQKGLWYALCYSIIAKNEGLYHSQILLYLWKQTFLEWVAVPTTNEQVCSSSLPSSFKRDSRNTILSLTSKKKILTRYLIWENLYIILFFWNMDLSGIRDKRKPPSSVSLLEKRHTWTPIPRDMYPLNFTKANFNLPCHYSVIIRPFLIRIKYCYPG